MRTDADGAGRLSDADGRDGLETDTPTGGESSVEEPVEDDNGGDSHDEDGDTPGGDDHAPRPGDDRTGSDATPGPGGATTEGADATWADRATDSVGTHPGGSSESDGKTNRAWSGDSDDATVTDDPAIKTGEAKDVAHAATGAGESTPLDGADETITDPPVDRDACR